MTHLSLDLNVEELAVLEHILQTELKTEPDPEPAASQPVYPTEPGHRREVVAGLADRVAWLHNAVSPR
jgi:hypothetical protein